MQTSDNAGTPAPPPAPSGKNGAGRAAFVAAMAARKADPAPDLAAEVKPPPAAGPAADAAEGDAPDADPADEIEAEIAAPVAAKPKDDAPDPAAAKRLAAAQKEERIKREQKVRDAKERADAQAAIAKERGEIDAARREMEADRKVLADLKRLRERARVDPDAALELIGVDGDYDTLARLAYSQTEAGQKDPNAKGYAARMMRERASRGEVGGVKGEVGELREQVAKLTERLEQTMRAPVDQATANDYLDNVEDSVGDDHPVLSRALTAAKARAADRTTPIAERREAKQIVKALRDEFMTVALDLYKRDGIEPDPADVAAEVEQRRVAEMRRWGLDPAALTQPAAPAKKPGTPPPQVLGRSGGSPTTPPRKLTPDEMKAEFVRKRAAGTIGEG